VIVHWRVYDNSAGVALQSVPSSSTCTEHPVRPELGFSNIQCPPSFSSCRTEWPKALNLRIKLSHDPIASDKVE
jgi:hypothetical protein